jgi:hypothetical protein
MQVNYCTAGKVNNGVIQCQLESVCPEWQDPVRSGDSNPI